MWFNFLDKIGIKVSPEKNIRVIFFIDFGEFGIF